MLVHASTCPHPPILIPTIGHENLKNIQNTVFALQKLEQELYARKPETIIIISPHGSLFPDAFTINEAGQYKGNFEQFGDLTTKLEYKGDIDFGHKIEEDSAGQFPFVLINEPALDYGSTVPLYYLTQNLKNFSIVPLGYSLLDYELHFDLGRYLHEKILETNKRVAVIASGDLSHRLTSEAPAGFSPKGEVFDKEFIKLLKARDVKGILNMDSTLIEEAGECGLRSIIILLGILDQINYQPEILSYEGPFGVGYLVANFKIK